MKTILKRLFIDVPIAILVIAGLVTIVIPIGYYVLTGRSYVDDTCEIGKIF